MSTDLKSFATVLTHEEHTGYRPFLSFRTPSGGEHAPAPNLIAGSELPMYIVIINTQTCLLTVTKDYISPA